MKRVPRAKTYDALKRLVDVFVGTLAIILTCPIQLIVAFLVWKNFGRPILFRQKRPGRHGQIFELTKFRSMPAQDEAKGLVSDADRLTEFGRFLRSTSLDELPTLLNVLKGDMSIVGPRPLLVQYLVRYTPEQAQRHEVRPGITGLAQVRGRNALTWEEKFALDVTYVKERSFGLDIRIILETFSSVASRRGINAAGDATMPEFVGSVPDDAVKNL